MKFRVVFLLLILLGLLGLPVAFSPASACDPATDPACVASATSAETPLASLGINSANPVLPLDCLLPDGADAMNAVGVPDKCSWMPLDIHTAKVVPTPVVVVKAPAAPTPKGDTPSSAMTISDASQTLAPGAMHWYKIDNKQNYYLSVWLDANGKSGITLSMYSPDQANMLSADLPPKGRGAFVKFEPHDLLWKGAFAYGVWYALVRNYNPTPIDYKIGIEGAATDRQCASYWESINGGPLILWTDCSHYDVSSKF